MRDFERGLDDRIGVDEPAADLVCVGLGQRRALGERQSAADHLLTQLAGDLGDDELVLAPEEHREGAGVHERPAPFDDHLEHAVECRHPAELVAELCGGLKALDGTLELGAALLGSRVETGVADRHRRQFGQDTSIARSASSNFPSSLSVR